MKNLVPKRLGTRAAAPLLSAAEPSKYQRKTPAARRPIFLSANVIRLLAACALMCVPAAVVRASNISAVWANEGGDKVTQDELRATHHTENLTGTVINRAWNGQTITLSGARNEVVSFNLVLEAAYANATGVSVSFDTLTGPNNYAIHSTPTTGNGVFNWVGRPIELFYTRYLQIKGLSFFGYDKFDERQIPRRFERPWVGTGVGIGGWTDRPDHDKFYPDILVPLELVQQFQINAGHNESIWSDIYIPKDAPSGTYSGNVTVSENGAASYTIPVQLNVYNFALPDVPTVKTMANLDTADIMWRYVTGFHGYANPGSAAGQRVYKITDKYFELFHRHKIALLGENDCSANDSPCAVSLPRLNGSLFTAANGYDGPGVGVSNGVYAVGMYGTWQWRNGATEASMWQHADNWVNWFDANAPGNDFFIYLDDEPSDAQVRQDEIWAQWLNQDPGPGKRLESLVTHHPVFARDDMPSVHIPMMHAGYGACPFNAMLCDVTGVGQDTANFYENTAGHRLWGYSDYRPSTGASETEADGTDMREIPWGQYKKGIQRWFYWYVNMNSQMDYFQHAITWGSDQYFDPVVGETGTNATTNGTGILSYPGTDLYNPSDSYGVDGPFASLRLKEWRRGIQDVDYLALASQINPTAVQAIINRVVPQVLWEYPTQYPTWWVGNVSWSDNPDDWESARAQLAQIISGGSSAASAPVDANGGGGSATTTTTSNTTPPVNTTNITAPVDTTTTAPPVETTTITAPVDTTTGGGVYTKTAVPGPVTTPAAPTAPTEPTCVASTDPKHPVTCSASE